MQDIIAKAKLVIARASERVRSMRQNASEETAEFVREAKAEEVFVAEAAKETMGRRWESLKNRVLSILGKLSPRERFALIFIVGLIVGFGVKTMASEHLTIGYRDYTTGGADRYDLVALQKKVAEEGSASVFSGGATGGAACSQ
jgi:hypothetical protein